MARFRSMALRPIHRIKHVVDVSAALAKATALPQSLIITKDAPVLANVQEVETGAKVNGFYLKIEVVANEDLASAGPVPNVYMAIQKNPGGNSNAVQANNVGVNDDKRFIIHQEMIMLQKQIQGNPRILFNGVIVIPKGYRRFGPNDTLTMNLFSPAVNILFCAQMHFKEFR